MAVTIATVDPEITRSDVQANYMVDADALDLQALWTTESDGSVTYSKVSFVPSGSNNTGATAPAITENRYLSLGQAGTLTIQMDIAASTNYNARTETKTITIHKYNSVFAGQANLNVLVDENETSAYTLTYTKPNAAYIGAANHVAGTPTEDGAFHYAVSHTVQTENVTGSPDGSVVITYNPSTQVATGKNKGVATVTLTQDETYKYNGATTSFDVNVSKHTPTFTWNSGSAAFNHDLDIANIFSSTNMDFAATSSSTNPNVAEMENYTLHIYNVDESDCRITMTQEENYKWNSAEETYNVVPVNRNNHLPFNTWNQAELNRFLDNSLTIDDDNNAWWRDSYVQLSGDGNKSMVLHFEGMPDEISFQYACENNWGGGNGTYWYVVEGPTLEQLTDTIIKEERGNTSWSETRTYLQQQGM